ncbi:MAG: SH3 domain-containing protein [Verrucomicrobia bacterium]|jgi:SH3-like domain-containing protein|nr:SH3 domain-containing protein [Verrucomicrobiota bacterium]MBT7068967.1 SH3 domain-containing protein [Verrucomicrobiota bacterium]MBT7702036.1 SH3 domain-containing protein [Verrucomicrobiota bacterium]
MKQIAIMMTLLLAMVASATAKPVSMSLQVRKGDLRSSPSFLGTIVGSAAYGDRFTVAEERGAWRRVTAAEGALTGWLHSSALTKKKIKLKAGEADADVAASSGELALAGKGFNAEVEEKFKEQNEDANFAAVDLIEAIRITTRQMQKFLKAGHVISKGGAE